MLLGRTDESHKSSVPGVKDRYTVHVYVCLWCACLHAWGVHCLFFVDVIFFKTESRLCSSCRVGATYAFCCYLCENWGCLRRIRMG